LNFQQSYEYIVDNAVITVTDTYHFTDKRHGNYVVTDRRDLSYIKAMVSRA